MSSDEFDELERHYPAHAAAEVGDTQALYKLISEASESDDVFYSMRLKDDVLNERSNRGWTPMHVAISRRQLDVVRILLEEGIEPRKLDGSPCLHFALCLASSSDIETRAWAEKVSELLRPKVDLLARDDRKQTALHVAALYGLVETVRALTTSDADSTVAELLEMKDRTGNRALHFAVMNGRQDKSAVEVVRLLIAANAAVDCVQVRGQTPLHLAAENGFWEAFRVLKDAGAAVTKTDKRGLSPAQLALENGHAIPEDLGLEVEAVGNGMVNVGLQVEQGRTAVLSHPLCRQHFTCPPIDHGSSDPPPENVDRLKVLLDLPDGVLRTGEFQEIEFSDDARRAELADVLRVHEWGYVQMLQQKCSALHDFLGRKGGPDTNIPEIGNGKEFESLDGDTVISARTFEAALRAAGSVIEGVDRVMSGRNRNVFCAVRPPGHHAGLRGVVTSPNDKSGSHGFCLLNNVGIAGAYARHCYRGEIDKVAIVDFDVHHGNGTEDVVRNLVPTREKFNYQTPFCKVFTTKDTWKPWLNEQDHEKVLFVSSHGYGKNSGVWFYPGSGSTCLPKDADSEAPQKMKDEETAFFSEEASVFSGYESETREDAHRILDLGLALPSRAVPGTSRFRFREGYRKVILPRLMAFNPDLILISAGFDGHRKDFINHGFLGLVEEDFEWVTDELIKVANSCCQGRVVSVLEGGYAIKGHHVSAFARSASAHVRALLRGSKLAKLWSSSYCKWESDMELKLLNKAKEKQEKKNREMLMFAAGHAEGELPAGEEDWLGVAKGERDKAEGSVENKVEKEAKNADAEANNADAGANNAYAGANTADAAANTADAEANSADAGANNVNAKEERPSEGNLKPEAPNVEEPTLEAGASSDGTTIKEQAPIEEPSRKRRRKSVDYVALNQKLAEEAKAQQSQN